MLPSQLKISDSLGDYHHVVKPAETFMFMFADRLCTESYQEFKSHPLFADADWALLEKADSIVSYEPAWNMLVQYKGKFQPKPDISKSRKRDKALIWNPADLTVGKHFNTVGTYNTCLMMYEQDCLRTPYAP